jgi:hypothetical protein
MGIVFGTLTYGFTGEVIEGATTKLGRPARKLAIDPTTSAWAKKVFDWFVREEISIREIVRRLNAAAAPQTSKEISKRWTYLIVRQMLDNDRYVGRWA